MGRSVAQVTQSLINSFQAINPSLDLLVGVTYDYTMAPVPQEISYCEQQVTNLQIYYSANFPQVATPQQASDFATNFGISASLGEYASGPVTFYRSTPPPAGTTFPIAVGQVVGTIDFQYLFQVVQAVTMLGDYASTYYNPTTGHYEITTLVQAVLPGSLYNLPANRITQIIGGSVGAIGNFSGISQTTAMSGGTDAETTIDLATRVIQQFKGINLNSVTGLATLASRYVPTGILDTSVVRPTDRLEFRRPTSGPSIDLCIAGSNIQNFTEEYFATGGELAITLQNATAVSVVQVQVNNAILDPSLWAFIPDTSPAYQGSTRAQPQIQFVNALNANDIVSTTGTKNYLLDSVQSVVEQGDDAIFQTDVLVRAFVELPVTVGLNVKVLNSPLIEDINDLQSDLLTIVTDYLESFPIATSYSYGGLSDAIAASLPNFVSVNVYTFRRTLSSIANVETIVPLKNQSPVLDTASSSLIVSS